MGQPVISSPQPTVKPWQKQKRRAFVYKNNLFFCLLQEQSANVKQQYNGKPLKGRVITLRHASCDELFENESRGFLLIYCCATLQESYVYRSSSSTSPSSDEEIKKGRQKRRQTYLSTHIQS
ncbi:hypothetical protein GUJ93_ZPchr0001g33219 [Zizania palustris]|uniref:Uncharacterized protein n=1 Tax=Zizania palustris TaxID=103762 RepID=A0A8J5VTR3_ZIZPA|nr:hypothetical protein GUJ93_ZPchr0001g33219 [Zizania palustris]